MKHTDIVVPANDEIQLFVSGGPNSAKGVLSIENKSNVQVAIKHAKKPFELRGNSALFITPTQNVVAKNNSNSDIKLNMEFILENT